MLLLLLTSDRKGSSWNFHRYRNVRRVEIPYHIEIYKYAVPFAVVPLKSSFLTLNCISHKQNVLFVGCPKFRLFGALQYLRDRYTFKHRCTRWQSRLRWCTEDLKLISKLEYGCFGPVGLFYNCISQSQLLIRHWITHLLR